MGDGKTLTENTMIRFNTGKVVILKQKISRELITIIASKRSFSQRETEKAPLAEGNCDFFNCNQDPRTYICCAKSPK
jgi:hypothetical protein